MDFGGAYRSQLRRWPFLSILLVALALGGGFGSVAHCTKAVVGALDEFEAVKQRLSVGEAFAAASSTVNRKGKKVWKPKS